MKIFISYSRKDKQYRDELESHLAGLKHADNVVVWSDQDLEPGDDWGKVISENLKKSDIIICLITKNFIASKACYNDEFKASIERHHSGEIRIIPVIVNPCIWQTTEIGKLQVIPENGSPIYSSKWYIPDEGYADAVGKIYKYIDTNRSIKTPPFAGIKTEPAIAKLGIHLPKEEQKITSKTVKLIGKYIDSYNFFTKAAPTQPEIKPETISLANEVPLVIPSTTATSKEKLQAEYFPQFKTAVKKLLPELLLSKMNAPKKMVFVQGGWFEMGNILGDGDLNEQFVHIVWVDDFYMDKYLVTQGEYEKVMGNNPSQFKGDPKLPVDSVTWHDAVEYCKRVGKRLPTEAEWEFAARSRGKKVKYATSTGELDHLLANYNETIGKTTPVSKYPPNELGLYDVSGNLWEWCADWYDGDYYRNSPDRNPKGPESGTHRVLRGGSWIDNPDILRVSYRINNVPSNRYFNIGFRCAQ